MAFEKLEAEIGDLVTRMQNEPKDRHEIYHELRRKLDELKAFDLPLPQDLVLLEQELEREFAEEAAAAERPEAT